MDNDVPAELWSVYEQQCAFAGVPVDEFVRSLAKGEHGKFSVDAVVALLETLLSNVLDNITLMAEADPRVASQADDRREEQTEFYQTLIAEVRGDT